MIVEDGVVYNPPNARCTVDEFVGGIDYVVNLVVYLATTLLGICSISTPSIFELR